MENPYFEIQEEKHIKSIEELLSYNMKKTYSSPGVEDMVINQENAYSVYSFPYETAGLFRGQINSWPLIPQSFRNVDLIQDFSKVSDIIKSYEYSKSTRLFQQFCKRTETQNPNFPQKQIDRMAIAQHYGVPTPLLDWSHNIFTAIFFSVKEMFSYEDFEKNFSVYIYHIVDERLLENNSDISDLSNLHKSAFVKPINIDRRIERQKGLFTFHPHPSILPKKIPLNVYILKEHTVLDLHKLMEGLGFTEDYYFPDYAGIANAVKNDSSL